MRLLTLDPEVFSAELGSQRVVVGQLLTHLQWSPNTNIASSVRLLYHYRFHVKKKTKKKTELLLTNGLIRKVFFAVVLSAFSQPYLLTARIGRPHREKKNSETVKDGEHTSCDT